MGERPGQEEIEHGRVGTAISTSTMGNSTAFGFSITITGAFGVLQAVVGSPSVAQVVLFGVGAALAIGVVEGVVTHGFRARTGEAPPEVRMLGTAQNFVSVAAGIGSVAGVGALIGSGAWVIGGSVASLVFLAAETTEIILAEWIQGRRGDPEAEQEE